MRKQAVVINLWLTIINKYKTDAYAMHYEYYHTSVQNDNHFSAGTSHTGALQSRTAYGTRRRSSLKRS